MFGFFAGDSMTDGEVKPAVEHTPIDALNTVYWWCGCVATREMDPIKPKVAPTWTLTLTACKDPECVIVREYIRHAKDVRARVVDERH